MFITNGVSRAFFEFIFNNKHFLRIHCAPAITIGGGCVEMSKHGLPRAQSGGKGGC